MKILIDIPTDQYNHIVYESIDELRRCVINGKVLEEKKKKNVNPKHPTVVISNELDRLNRLVKNRGYSTPYCIKEKKDDN